MSTTDQTRPARTEAYVMACLVQGAWERALEVIDEVGPLPVYSPHLAGVAGRLLAAKQTEAALLVATRAAEMAPDRSVAQSVLGRVHLAMGNVSDAEAALRRATELDSRELVPRVTLANLYLDQGRLHEARPLIEEALERAPADETAWSALKRLRKAVDSLNRVRGQDRQDRIADSPVGGSLGHKPATVPSDHPVHPVHPCLNADAAELRRLASQVHERRSRLRPPTLTLCLIARNEALNLPRVIRSVRDVATEVIVVDTGSTDDTMNVARRLGAQVERFEWIDDFAAARNHSLQFATGEWILVMDADDELVEEDAPLLRYWLAHAPPVEVVALFHRIPYPHMQRDVVSTKARLFRSGRGMRFEGAIHEYLVTADGQPARPGATLTVMMHHHGYVEAPDAMARRDGRNLRLLQAQLARNPDDSRIQFYLGLTMFGKDDWEAAIPHFRAAIDRAPEPVDYHPKSYACMADSLLKLKRPLEAEAVLQEALARYPEHPELLCCLGATLDNLGRLEEAIAAHEAALRGRFGPSMNWNDYTCRDSRPHLALCDLQLSLGDPEAARRHLETAERFTGPRPDYPQIREAIAATAAELKQEAAARQRELSLLRSQFAAGNRSKGLPLTRLLLQEGSIEEAGQRVDQWLESEPNSPDAQVSHGLVLLSSGAPEEAQRCFAAVRERHPDCADAWRGEAEAWRALSRPEAEEQALLQAAEQVRGGDGQSLRALGEFYLTQERWDDAASCMQRSLERRNDVWATWLGLGRAMLRTGNLPQAIQCYQHAAALSGGNAAVRRALGEACACLSPTRDNP